MTLAHWGPMPLISFENSKIIINQHALKILADISVRVSVVGVCGQGGDGNSTLCNYLLKTGI
jgi:putative protein kinase ArgK-like GTPase of G3E family